MNTTPITCDSSAERECTGCKHNKMGKLWTQRGRKEQKVTRKEKKNTIKASLDGVTCPVLFTGVWSGESQKPRVRQLEVGLVGKVGVGREVGLWQRWKFVRIDLGVFLCLEMDTNISAAWLLRLPLFAHWIHSPPALYDTIPSLRY